MEPRSATRPRARAAGLLASGAGFVAALGLTSYSFASYAAATSAIERTREVERAIEDLDATVAAGEAGEHAYVLTGGPEYLVPFRRARDRVGVIVAKLRAAVDGGPDQQDALARAEVLAADDMREMSAAVELYDRSGPTAARTSVVAAHGERFERLEQHLATMRARAATRFEQSARASRLGGRMSAIGLALTGVLFGVFATFAWTTKREREARIDEEQREIARLAEERETLEARVRVARFQEELVGILGHDLRTPLTSILMGTDTLMRRHLGEEEERVVRRIAAAAKRMERMVKQLLDYARSRLGGGLPVARAPADLQDVSRQAIEELAATSPGRAIELTSRGDARGAWDADRLAQLVSNLVGNALVHGSPRSPIHVAIDGTAAAEVTLEVENRGEPIPEPMRAHVFEPYRRGRDAAGTEGLGLGLYIAHEIVVAHGGAVEVESSAEAGTRFVVRLPRRA